MQGQIAQAVALTLYANAYLRERLAKPFTLKNSTCQYVKTIDFLAGNTRVEPLLKKGKAILQRLFRQNITDETTVHAVASNPQEWFAYSQKSQVKRLILHRLEQNIRDLKDHKTVGMVDGGPRWVIIAERKNCNDCWESHWEVGDRNDKEQKIWLVAYARVGEAFFTPNGGITSHELDQSRVKLSLALKNALALATEVMELNIFADCFNRTIAAFSSPEPLETVPYKDIAPPDFLPLPALQLLAAAQLGWVFGGMGTWNDVCLDDSLKNRYDEVSSDLFNNLTSSVITVTNSRVSSSN